MKKTVLFACLTLALFASEFQPMQHACDKKVATACFEFGLLYEKGLGVEQNRTKAIDYFTKGCEYGYDNACQKLDILHIGK